MIAENYRGYWQLLGHDSDIPDDGDWFAGDLGGRPVFVQRVGTALVAFENICPHQSFPVRQAEYGNGAIRCPLHRWGFDASGRLCHVPGCTPADLAAFGSNLTPVEIARAGGLVFGRLAAGPGLTACLDGATGLVYAVALGRIDLALSGENPGPKAWLELHDALHLLCLRRALPTDQTVLRCWVLHVAGSPAPPGDAVEIAHRRLIALLGPALRPMRPPGQIF